MKLEYLGSDFNKIMGNIPKLPNMDGIIGKIPKMPEIATIQPIAPFHKSITTEEALEDESDYIEERFDIDKNSCENCNSSLEDGAYVLKNKEKIFYFCSTKCINHFKEQGNNINDYELINVSRCASYKCCLELGNLRRMCERKESLNNKDLVGSLNRVNFCEPAVAGQIQASYSIYKHLQKVDLENSKLSAENTKLNKRTQFLTIVSTIMTVLTIILTGLSVAKSFFDKPIEYKEELKDIEQAIQKQQNEIETIRQIGQSTGDKLSDIEKAIIDKEVVVNLIENGK